MRRNIFEINYDSFDFVKEIDKIKNDFDRHQIDGKITIERLVDNLFWFNWKQKGRTSSLKEFKLNIGIHFKLSTIEEFLVWCEYALNICYITKYVESKGSLEEYQNYKLIIDYFIKEIKYCLDREGYSFKVYRNEQKVILIKTNAVASSVAELVDDHLAYQVFEYNTPALKGDINAKKSILLALSNEFEGFKKTLNSNNYGDLASDIGFMLNKLNVRHNNTEDKAGNKFLSLPEIEQEKWYDKLYDLLLHAILINDYIKSKNEIKEFKKFLNE